jgi:hypothetical protein
LDLACRSNKGGKNSTHYVVTKSDVDHGTLQSAGEGGQLVPGLLRPADLGRDYVHSHEEAELRLSFHGFRATLRTWAEEQTDASFEVKESCLDRAVDTGVVSACQKSDRLEKRRALL